jgi:beta-galactosidase
MEWNGSVRGLAFGADYNPEQWPEHVWDEDIGLMQGAEVNLVSVGIFSWAHLEPRPQQFRFGWLDRVLDLLHSGGFRAYLATSDGRRLWPGSRQAWCPSSPIFRERAVLLVERMAEHYRDHSALALWHISSVYERPVDLEGNDLISGEQGTVSIAAGGVAFLKDV